MQFYHSVQGPKRIYLPRKSTTESSRKFSRRRTLKYDESNWRRRSAIYIYAVIGKLGNNRSSQEWSRLRKYRCDVFTARDRPISLDEATVFSFSSLFLSLSLVLPKFRHSSVSTVDNGRHSALIVIRAKNENLFSTR